MTSTYFTSTLGTGSGADRRQAVREIAVFLTVTAALLIGSTAVALGEGVNVARIDDASPVGQAAMYGQALFPLLAALVARLAVARTLRGAGWGFRRAPWSALGRAWGYGLAVTLGGALLVWLSGAGGLDLHAAGPVTIAGLTVLVLPYVVLALGEDVGWRGLLTTRLAEIGSPRTVILVGGVAWSAFHWPLILLLGGTPDGVPALAAMAFFTVGTTAFGAVLASMQVRWGIWPGVVAHAVFNATMYHVIEPLVVERDHTGWFATETGLFAAIVGVLGAMVWLRAYPLRTRRA